MSEVDDLELRECPQSRPYVRRHRDRIALFVPQIVKTMVKSGAVDRSITVTGCLFVLIATAEAQLSRHPWTDSRERDSSVGVSAAQPVALLAALPRVPDSGGWVMWW